MTGTTTALSQPALCLDLKKNRIRIHKQTLHMLEDPEYAMWEFSERAIFDIWESEQVTGDPRNSVYIRVE